MIGARFAVSIAGALLAAIMAVSLSLPAYGQHAGNADTLTQKEEE